MSETYEIIYDELLPVILIRVEDFHILGYREIKPENIWHFLTASKWKNKETTPRLHERINDVMQMNIGQLMQFITSASSKKTSETRKLDKSLVQEVLAPNQLTGKEQIEEEKENNDKEE